MKIKFLFTLFFISSIIHAEGVWVRKADFPGSSRSYGVSFSIGTKGYYGMGQKQVKAYSYKLYNDFWEYDSETNVWTQKADFPAGGRLKARGFSVKGKGYVGFGYQILASGPNIGSEDYEEDFYEFNFSQNTWTKKNNSYVGGNDIFFVFQDTVCAVDLEDRIVKKYNSATDTWTQSKWEKKALAPNYMNVHENSVDFSILDKGYIITYVKKKRNYINQLWEFDPHSITWNYKNDLPVSGTDTITSFSMGDRGYVMRGSVAYLIYDPASDKWAEKMELSIPNQFFEPSFIIGDKIYGFSKHEFLEFTP